MARKAWLNIAGVALLIILVSSVGLFLWLQPSISFCTRNDQIDARARAAIVATAQAYVTLLRDGETTAALEAMTPEGRARTERIALVNIVEHIQAEPGGDPSVQEVLSLVTYGGQRGMTPCSSDRAHPTFVSRGAGMNTAFVLIAEPIEGGERTTSLWLARQDGRWRVHGAHVGRSAVAGRDGARFRRDADAQRVRGNAFNATLLYEFARITLNRGNWYQSADAYGFSRAYTRLQRHRDLSPSAPHTFRLGGEEFSIGYLQVVGTGDGSFLLLLEQRAETPEDVPGAIARNRALIDAMNRYRPEWREVFDGLASAYPTGGTNVWRTVYDAESGYVSEAPP